MIGLVLSDLDSTLVWREDHLLSRFAIEAIHELQDSGVEFAPATGRTHAGVTWMSGEDERVFRTAVTNNGQQVFLDGRLICDKCFPVDDLRHLNAVLATLSDSFLCMEWGEERYAIDTPAELVETHPDNFWRLTGCARGVIADRPCSKTNVRVVGSWGRCLEVRAMLGEVCPNLDFVLPMPGVSHIDILPGGWGKAQGSDVLMEALGLTPSEVVCFGDADNDISLLEHYANSVAVANATAEAAAAANHRVGDCADESVAKAMLEVVRANAAGETPAFLGA